MIMQEKEIRSLLEGIMAENPGKALGISVNGDETGSTRFANNAITTNGVYSRLNLDVEVIKSKKRGVTSINQLDREKIREAVAKADALADVAPENPELMPQLGPQSYPPVPSLYFKSTTEFPPGRKADAIMAIADQAKRENLESAGFFETGSSFTAHMNAQGLYYYFPATRAYFSTTLRSSEAGSGWASAEDENVDKLEVERLVAGAMRKALASRKPQPLAAGKYAVILEPAAVADLIFFLIFGFDAREADEGRSFLSLAEGKNRMGKKLVSSQVTIYSDPAFPEMPSSPVGEDGLARKKTLWIDRGIVKNLRYSRFWAAKMGKDPVSFAYNIIMEGGKHSLDDLIRSTKKGVLVSRFFYIRDLNPMILLLTGLTRDGTFLIENGKISHPVNNFRFNESPVNMLRNVEMMSRSARAMSDIGLSLYAPALKVKEFNFASVSEAV